MGHCHPQTIHFCTSRVRMVSRCGGLSFLLAVALAASSHANEIIQLSRRELHSGWSDHPWEDYYADDDNSWSSGYSSKGSKSYSRYGKSGKGRYGKNDGPSHWYGGWTAPPHFWQSGWPIDEFSGKSGKSSSSKGSKGSNDNKSDWSSTGWYEWTQPHNFDTGKSGKGSSKSGKSKGAKSSSSRDHTEGFWIWVDDDDYWSGPEPEDASGKSGKSNVSGKSGKSDYDDVEPIDKWNDDGWGKSEVIYSKGGVEGGWNSDGWESDGHYKADLDYVRAEVTKLVEDSNRELIPKFLRLGFHDCVGGCDGCIDLDNLDNKGLDEPINAIYPIVEKFKDSYSRSDIWVMASLVSADLSIVEGRPAGLHFPMRYIGRTDCEGADTRGVGGPEVEMPSNHLTTHELLEFFKEYFDFDTEETVIIMGVHAVGTAHRDISGFGVEGEDFGWVFNADDYVMDNRYYKMLVGDEDPVLSAPLWEGEIVHNEGDIPSRYQWYHKNDGEDERPIMTSADIALVRDLSGFMYDDVEVEGIVECVFNDESASEFANDSYRKQRSLQRRKPVCPVASETLELMIEYKMDNELWLIDFERVLEKMLRNGYSISS